VEREMSCSLILLKGGRLVYTKICLKRNLNYQGYIYVPIIIIHFKLWIANDNCHFQLLLYLVLILVTPIHLYSIPQKIFCFMLRNSLAWMLFDSLIIWHRLMNIFSMNCYAWYISVRIMHSPQWKWLSLDPDAGNSARLLRA
jgi:hypothetical protein